MKKILSAVILAVLLLFSGCSVHLENAENQEIRQTTETILDALIANDIQGAYPLFRQICTEDDFDQLFAQLQTYIGPGDTYQLELLTVSFHKDGFAFDDQTVQSVLSEYEVATQSGRFIINIRIDSDVGMTTFYLTPYERTDRYFTGTLENMESASVAQWALLLINVLVIAFVVCTLIDCCRQKIKRKVLWIPLIILGFVTVGATIAANGFRFNFHLGWITAYTALIRYGSGTMVIRLLIPVGAIVYWIRRKALIKKNLPTVSSDIPEENNDQA